MKSEKPNADSMFCSNHFVASSLIYVYVTNDDVSAIKVLPYILFCSHKTYIKVVIKRIFYNLIYKIASGSFYKILKLWEIHDLFSRLQMKYEMYLHYIVHSTYVTSSAETHHVCITTEVNFITPAYRYTQWLSIPSASNVKCQLVYFSGGHFAYPQSRLDQ